MAETECGKSCTECKVREEMNCPGCKFGPGGQYVGICELTKCCYEKGLETCENCASKESCGNYLIRDRKPELRQARIEAIKRARESECEEEITILEHEKDKNTNSLLSKRMLALFWLTVIGAITAIFGSEVFLTINQFVFIGFTVINKACYIASAVILLKLSTLSGNVPQYRAAGICMLISVGLNYSNLPVVLYFVDLYNDINALTIALVLPSLILGVIAMYNECSGHSDILIGVNNSLSDKWRKLKEYILIILIVELIVGIIGGIVVWLFLPVLVKAVLLIGSIGFTVINIIVLVFLYLTAKSFANNAD